MVNTTRPQNPTREPVINNPYQQTEWHWPLDSNVMAFGPAQKGRRLSLVMPSVVSERGIRTGGQVRANDMSTPWDDIPLVNKVRDKAWAWADAGFLGATHVTKSLLSHWIAPDDDQYSRLYFAQQDAILAAVYLNEGDADPGHADVVASLDHELEQQRQYKPDQQRTYNHLDRMGGVRRHCHKMATGTGKTAVIAALILYHAANHEAQPDDPRFVAHFLVLAPNLTVKKRLQSAVIPSADQNSDEYAERDLLPSPREKYRQALSQSQVVVANWQSFQPREPEDKPSATALKVIKASDPGAQTNYGETPAEAALRVAYDRNPATDRVLVINDEAHHCHYGNPDKPDAKPTIWLQGIMHLRDAGVLHGVVDMSATPTFPEATRGHGLFPWIVSDCNLVEAQEAGLTKIPRVPTYGKNEDASHMRNIYNDTSKKERDRFDGNNCDLLREALRNVADDWVGKIPDWKTAHAEDDRSAALPAVAVVVNSVANANAVYEYVAKGRAGDALLTGETEHPFSNWRDSGEWSDGPPRTIVVHSAVDDPEKKASDAPKAMQSTFEELAERYQRYYPELDGLEPLETIRQVLNSVGRPGQPGEHVRCVISVGMLTEGWDARNVTHLVGFRPFKSSLLCEQVAGRTLRRSVWDADPETGFFSPEYATVLGIPFRDSVADGEGTLTTFPLLTVSTPPDREDFRIEWPNVRELNMPDARQQRLAALLRQLPTGPEAPRHRVPGFVRRDFILEPVMGSEEEMKGLRPLTKQAWRYRVAGAITRQVTHDARDGSMGTEVEDDCEPQHIMPQSLFCDLLNVMTELENSGHLILPDDGLYPPDDESLNESADFIRNIGVEFKFLNPTRQAMTVVKSRTEWLDTEVQDFVIQDDPKRVLKHCVKSHANHARCDSEWERRAATMLDQHPDVLRWARNHRLRWEIPYVYQGQARVYRPDFVAVVAMENGQQLHVVIEVKGQEDAGDIAKKRWAETWWVPAVNADADYGTANGRRWSYLYLDEAEFTAGIELAFNNHLREQRSR